MSPSFTSQLREAQKTYDNQSPDEALGSAMDCAGALYELVADEGLESWISGNLQESFYDFATGYQDELAAEKLLREIRKLSSDLRERVEKIESDKRLPPDDLEVAA